MVGRLWTPANPGDWESDAGMLFLSKVITDILRDNARLDDPSMHLGDIDATIMERGLNGCLPSLEVEHECLCGNPGRFQEVAPDMWALSRACAYAGAEEWAAGFECSGSSTIAPPTDENPPPRFSRVGRRWRPTNPWDWETAAGMLFLSKVITGILRDNARLWHAPCVHFLDIDATIEREFNDCYPGLAVVHECLCGNPGRFREMASNAWALSRACAYSGAEEWTAVSECFGSGTIAPPTLDFQPQRFPLVGRRWHPTNLGDWETAAGMLFLSKVITRILRDNARLDYPYPWWHTPCLHFLDIDITIEGEFNDCFPSPAVEYACLSGNPDRFQEVGIGMWALTRACAYAGAGE